MTITIIALGWLTCSAAGYILCLRDSRKNNNQYTKLDRTMNMLFSTVFGPAWFLSGLVFLVIDFVSSIRWDDEAKW
jgi:tryptophan-rich sensory protein